MVIADFINITPVIITEDFTLIPYINTIEDNKRRIIINHKVIKNTPVREVTIVFIHIEEIYFDLYITL